jgi:hypothetical protein
MTPEVTLLTQAIQELLATSSASSRPIEERNLLYTVLTEVHGAAFAFDLAARHGDADTFPNADQRVGYLKTLHEHFDDEYHL